MWIVPKTKSKTKQKQKTPAIITFLQLLSKNSNTLQRDKVPKFMARTFQTKEKTVTLKWASKKDTKVNTLTARYYSVNIPPPGR